MEKMNFTQFNMNNTFTCVCILTNKEIIIGDVNGSIEKWTEGFKQKLWSLSIFTTEILYIFQDRKDEEYIMVINSNNLVKVELKTQIIVGIIQVKSFKDIIFLSKSRVVFVREDLFQVFDVKNMILLSYLSSSCARNFGSGARVYGSKFIIEQKYHLDEELFWREADSRYTIMPKWDKPDYLSYYSSSDSEIDEEIKNISLPQYKRFYLKSFSIPRELLQYYSNLSKLIAKIEIDKEIKNVQKYSSKASFLNLINPKKYQLEIKCVHSDNPEKYIFKKKGLSKNILDSLSKINIVSAEELIQSDWTFPSNFVEKAVNIGITNYTLKKETKKKNWLLIFDYKCKKNFLSIIIDKDEIGDKIIRLNKYRFIFIHKLAHLLLLDLNNYSCTMLEKKDKSDIISVHPYQNDFILVNTANNNLLIWKINTLELINQINLEHSPITYLGRYNSTQCFIICKVNDKNQTYNFYLINI